MLNITFNNFFNLLCQGGETNPEDRFVSIAKAINNNARIIVWPYAQMGKEFYEFFTRRLNLKNEFIKVAQDTDKDDVRSPVEVDFTSEDVVVIATRRYGDEISSFLEKKNITNWIMSFEMALLYPEYRQELFGGQLTLMEQFRDSLLNKKESYLKLYFTLRDSESKQLFLSNMMYRLTKNPRYAFIRSTGETYFDQDLFDLKPAFQGAVIDAGGFNGDTLKSFLDLNEAFGSYHLFEPDPDQFDIAVSRSDSPNVYFNNCGIYSSTKTLFLNRNAHDREHITLKDNGDFAVEVITLDEYCKNLDVSLIKMDIEGGETDAIKGALETIKRCNPVLSICIYHLADDYIDIFNLIQSTGCNYTYYIRKYSTCFVDTVLYAVPC